MKGFALFMVALVGGVIAVTQLVGRGGGSSAAGNEIAAYCRSNATKAASGLDTWVSNGTVATVSKEKLEVDEKKWEAIAQDAKVSIAVFGYCNAISGKATDSAVVLIRGYKDGAIKASIVDGNYMRQ